LLIKKMCIRSLIFVLFRGC